MKYFQERLYEITGYVPGEQPKKTEKVIKLNTNENPYPPSPKILKSIQKIFEKGLLRKYPVPDSFPLRVAISELHSVEPENILVTNGSDEGLSILFRACLKPNSKIVIPYPTYSLYPVLVDLEMNGSEIIKIPLKENLHFDFETLKNSKGDLLAFANPNAPTGILESKEDLLNLIGKFPGIVLCDEAYVDFAKKSSGMVKSISKYSNLVVSRTFSKSYSLAGLRVGYLVSSKENISELHKIKDSYNLGLLEQQIAITALSDRKYHNKTISKIIDSREKMSKSLKKLGFNVVPSETNFLFIKPPKKTSPEELFQFLKSEKIFIRFFNDSFCKDYLRITIGTPLENENLIKKIKFFLYAP
jgi:histidinol-phosphate aminotransferase